MNEGFEDEDVILENSPLNQYLREINLSDIDRDTIPKPTTNNRLTFPMLASHALGCVSEYRHLIKRKILGNRVLSILHFANSIDVLSETDGMYLQYLIDTRSIHWDNVASANKSASYGVKQPLLLILMSTIIYFVFGKSMMCLFLFMSFAAYLLILLVYGFFIRYLLTFFFQRLVTISVQSRQTILLIQELLSLNQGYSRLVHMNDNFNYDCTKSFNEELLQKFCCQLFSTLSDLSSFMNTSNGSLLYFTMKCVSFIKDVPWFQQEEGFNTSDDIIDEPNYKQPIGQLKLLHNLIQSQFSECLKMLVLWSYYLDNHPSLGLPMHIICCLYRFTDTLQQLVRYRKMFQMKTKLNLSYGDKIEGNTQMTPVINSLRTLDLHLFEISEFSTQLSKNIVKIQKRKQRPNMEWLISQRELVEKSKRHFDALQGYWQGLCDELDILLDNNCRQSVIPEANIQEDKASRGYEETEEPVVIDSYPEIVDEVIEGIPDEFDNSPENGSRNQLVDPFEERYTINAKAILNELKSVIDVRAKDWKKREKLALKRRAAEGKFVFKKEQQNDEIDGFTELGWAARPTVDNVASVSDSQGIELDWDFRRSLAEMVVKQRQNMMMDSSVIGGGEECFGD